MFYAWGDYDLNASGDQLTTNSDAKYRAAYGVGVWQFFDIALPARFSVGAEVDTSEYWTKTILRYSKDEQFLHQATGGLLAINRLVAG